MTNNEKTTLAAEDTKRRNFMPIQMDLVERLTRQADTLSGKRVSISSDTANGQSRLAA